MFLSKSASSLNVACPPTVIVFKFVCPLNVALFAAVNVSLNTASSLKVVLSLKVA